jgi:hypothetical protein
MKGAGQNFGVVPSATFETYPQVPDGLHYNADMVFADEALEQVIGVINSLIPNQPVALALHFISFAGPYDSGGKQAQLCHHPAWKT